MWVATLFLVLGIAEGQLRVDPLVNTDAGLIRGLRAEDGEYSMFLGIPYGYVEEDNPFGAARAQPRFDAVFEAVDDSAVCPQVEEFGSTIVGSLDCLHLNIYVPDAASSDSRMPVLVWIYGGGFSIGFANRFLYGPKYLVRHDVILVTLNYRLGPYGFFCLDTPEVPGNQGLKDQLLAMRWIKVNIASFGGDDTKITLMGESAGGVSIEYHLMSKNEKLFNQVILQSGTVFITTLLANIGASKLLRIAENLGLVTEDVTEALEFLAKIDTNTVIAAAAELGLAARPCVEQEFEGVESVVTDYPINLPVPEARNMPILIGFNNKEQMARYVNMPAENFNNLNIFETVMSDNMNYDEEFKEMEEIVRRFYIGDEETSAALRWNISDFHSDYMYNYPVQMSLKKYLESDAQKVYYYMFSYSGGRNFVKNRLNITEEGAVHADEIGYLFDISYEDPPVAEDQLVIDRMTTMWTNFAKYGDPTPQTTELLPVKWTPITEGAYTYLDIGSELTLGRRPYHDRMAFWELFYDINKRKVKGYREN